jgi:DNA polymerase III subunit delta'
LQQSEYKHLEWHDSAWSQLWAPGAGLPHALLLTGPEGVGKSAFAHALAARLLCEAPVAGQACGSCSSCRWLGAGNHPDFRHVFPEADAEASGEEDASDKKKASRQILIDQIRALESFVFVGGHRNGARVVVVEPAEAMNIAAENSLLKILEEPPASVYFILVSNQWRRLLPTIRSRCRLMKLGRPTPEQADQWLTAQGHADAAKLLPVMGGAPLLALRETERGRAGSLAAILSSLADPGHDPLSLAGRWESLLQGKNDEGLTMENLMAAIQKWIFDLCQFRLAGRTRYQQRDADKQIAALAKNASPSGLIRCYNETIKMRALASHPLNPRLYLEDMAERYLRALAPERP